MRKGKKPWKNIAYILVLLAAIVVLFHWYSTENSRRTEIRNLNYAVDSARQSVKRIEGAFTNGILRLRNYAYLLGTGENQQEIDVDMLNGLEENSVFDAIRYTDADGNTLASSGMVVDGRDREYYSRGMQGESWRPTSNRKLQLLKISFQFCLFDLRKLLDFNPANGGFQMIKNYHASIRILLLQPGNSFPTANFRQFFRRMNADRV